MTSWVRLWAVKRPSVAEAAGRRRNERREVKGSDAVEGGVGARNLARTSLLAGLLTASFLVAGASPAAGDRTDTVELRNGDQITGEVKSLDRAKLRFKTDHMRTLDIEWPEVRAIVSADMFEVELASGEKLYGALEASEQAGMLSVVGESQTSDVDLDQVVRITPLANRFLARLDGSLDFGFSFVQANKATSLTVNGDVSSRTRKTKRAVRVSSTLSDHENVDRVARNDGTFTFTRFLGSKWQTQALGRVESNEELGLELRTSAGAGVGRFVVQTNHSTLLFVGGLSVNRENYRDASEGEDNLEALVGLEYSLFTFGDQDSDLSIRTVVWPSLSDSGRVRVDADIRFRRELIKDFYLGVTLYESFDSEPPTVGAVRNDWGVSMSIGYSF